MKPQTIYTATQRASLNDLLNKAKAQGNKVKERANKVNKDVLISSIIWVVIFVIINVFLLYVASTNIGTTKTVLDNFNGNDEHTYLGSLGSVYNNYPSLVGLHMFSFLLSSIGLVSTVQEDKV